MAKASKIAGMLFAVTTMFVGTVFACQGNACGDLKFSVNGNCHSVQNSGSRKIRVQWGPFGPKDLSPGESWTIINPFGGACVGTIIGDVTANDVATPPLPSPPAPPVHRPTDPTGFSDERFRFLGIQRFWRTPKQGGLTQAMSVPVVLDPGMEIDTDYHQSNERRGPLFHCCAGGATSPLTVNQIPAGFYVEIGGSEYYSAREPILTRKLQFDPNPPVSDVPTFRSDPIFQMTLYCGPPSDKGCEVNMKVWVVQQLKRVMAPVGPGAPIQPTGLKAKSF